MKLNCHCGAVEAEINASINGPKITPIPAHTAMLPLDIAKSFRVASRRFYGSPASGSPARFTKVFL